VIRLAILNLIEQNPSSLFSKPGRLQNAPALKKAIQSSIGKGRKGGKGKTAEKVEEK